MRKRLTGEVTSDKMSKTRRVEVSRFSKHPKYGKTMKARTVCHVHDEENASKLGDIVEIEESRPLSKTKRWTLVQIVRRPVVADAVAVETPAAAEPAPTAGA